MNEATDRDRELARRLWSGAPAATDSVADMIARFYATERAAQAETAKKLSEAIDQLADAGVGLRAYRAEVEKLRAAIAEHHSQRADDRCWLDDMKLYEAAGLPPCDRRVGDKAAMLKNCERFINNRCESGGQWKSYAELEAEVAAMRDLIHGIWIHANMSYAYGQMTTEEKALYDEIISEDRE